MGELSLIKQFRAGAPAHPWVVVGPGQDCAILRWPSDRDLAFKIDQIVEGTFRFSHAAVSSEGALPLMCGSLAFAVWGVKVGEDWMTG